MLKQTLCYLLFILTANLSEAQSLQPNYGIILNLNYTTIGTNLDNYVGRGLGSFGMYYQHAITPFYSTRFLNGFDYTIEPAYSVLGFRDKQTDKRFTGNYIDLTTTLDYIPDRISNDLRIIAGLRPSVMINNSTEIPDGNGGFNLSSYDPSNQNSIGRIDLAGVIGVGVSLGDVASIELKYAHSFTNQTTESIFKGRPSYIEFGIRLSAIRIRDKIATHEKNLTAELNKRSAGTLLIMLETPNEKLIQQLINEKRLDDAAFVRNLQTQTNKNVISQFNKYFTFCKVHYFFDKDAAKVNRREFDNVFVDYNLTPIAPPPFDTGNYIIGAFCEDISDYTRKPDYGLYIYDDKFIQLGKPYNGGDNNVGIYVGGDPMNYFRRIKTSVYNPEEFGRVIKRLNDRLINLREVGK